MLAKVKAHASHAVYGAAGVVRNHDRPLRGGFDGRPGISMLYDEKALIGSSDTAASTTRSRNICSDSSLLTDSDSDKWRTDVLCPEKPGQVFSSREIQL